MLAYKHLGGTHALFVRACVDVCVQTFNGRLIQTLAISGSSGRSRISERWFPLVVDHRCRGLGAQPPIAEEVLIFKSIQSIESYILYLRPLSIMS